MSATAAEDRQRAAANGQRVQKSRGHGLAVSGAAVAMFVLVWHLASAYGPASILFPGPAATGRAIIAMLEDGTLQSHVGISLKRIAIGFACGIAVGVPLGLAMGTFRPVRIFFEPYLQFFRFVPAIAWLVPAILWFGIGELSKIFLIFYTTIFLVLLNTMVGVASVQRNQVRAAECFGANAWQTYAWVVFPGDHALRSRRHAARHGQFVCCRGRGRAHRHRAGYRLPDLRVVDVDGRRPDVRRDGDFSVCSASWPTFFSRP